MGLYQASSETIVIDDAIIMKLNRIKPLKESFEPKNPLSVWDRTHFSIFGQESKSVHSARL